MRTRKIIANYYDTEEERDKQKNKFIEYGFKILYESKIEEEYGFTYEIIYK